MRASVGNDIALVVERDCYGLSVLHRCCAPDAGLVELQPGDLGVAGLGDAVLGLLLGKAVGTGNRRGGVGRVGCRDCRCVAIRRGGRCCGLRERAKGRRPEEYRDEQQILMRFLVLSSS